MIPEEEIEFEFDRASGPGGQNINKRETKVHARWKISDSRVFSDEQKDVISRKCANDISQDGYLVVYAQETRSQRKNRELARDKLDGIVRTALTPVKSRVPTKVPRRAREARLHAKRYTRAKKALRSKITGARSE